MIIRQPLALLLALSPLLMEPVIAHADEVTQAATPANPVSIIDEKISSKQTEIDNLKSKQDSEIAQLQQLKSEQERLKRESIELEAKRNRSKSDLDKQYTRLLEDPNTDLTSFQKQYQEIWSELKKNQSLRLDNEQKVTESEMHLSQLKQKYTRLESELGNLKESRVEARVKRINAELLETRSIEVNYKTTCSVTMTLGDCANQGLYLTKQKAVSAFQERLINSLTEASVAKQHMKDVNLNITIRDSQILSRGFQGNNDYFTSLQAQLQARPLQVAGCTLLGISTRYCMQGDKTYTPKKEKQWASITVRSDQYQDSVTIDGVNYGNTPVEVVLPLGQHQVTVSKKGYETYSQIITVTGNDTVWVKLRPSKPSS